MKNTRVLSLKSAERVGRQARLGGSEGPGLFARAGGRWEERAQTTLGGSRAPDVTRGGAEVASRRQGKRP